MEIIISSYKFAVEYLFQYLKELLKPFGFLLLGIAFFCAIFLKSYFILLSLVSIPLFCYAFWRGYVLSYNLIPCAERFFRGERINLKDIKTNEKDLALWVVFVAFLTLVLYIPSFIYAWKTSFITSNAIFEMQAQMHFISAITKAFLINTFVLSPFLNFALPVYHFKAEGENFLDLFLNCYRKLNFKGFLIALLIVFLYFGLSRSTIGAFFCVIFNIFINPINTYWYSSRLSVQEN